MARKRPVSAAIRIPVRNRFMENVLKTAELHLLRLRGAVYVGIATLLEKILMADGAEDKKDEATPRELPAAAQRALAEAEERRKKARLAEELARPKPKEVGGPQGLEPTRYGD